MSEGALLLLLGLLYGLPLIIGFIYFGIFMINHSKDMDKRLAELRTIKLEREAREDNLLTKDSTCDILNTIEKRR